MKFTAAVTLCAFVATTVFARAARAQDDATFAEAKAHFEAGKNAFIARDYPGAIREFKLAESLRPSPILDYNIALAYAELHKPRVAANYFRRYLAGSPNAQNRADVERRIADLERQASAQPPPPPTEAPVYEAPPPGPPVPAPRGYDPYAQSPEAQPVAPPVQPAPARSYWWVWLVVVGGVLLIATIVGVAVYASSFHSTASTAGDRALVAPERAPPADRTPGGAILFRF
jgi:hypothetical protein